MGVTIFSGLHPHLRPDAARIYWEAFGGKLGRILGPDPQALAFLERVIRADLCIAALDDQGALLGLAGFKTPAGSFAGGSRADLTAIYGPFGGLWRGWILGALSGEVDNDRFLVDGICVARNHRSKGIGTLLLAALYDEAAGRGYHSVRLDVIDANWRARALYEREGFLATQTQTIGLLRHLFRFAAATTMVRPLRSQGR
jgi:ribosomal protein S18 acetylase RimI-like enzyme